MRNDRATVARIELAENLAALASDLGEAVMFIAERSGYLTDADEDELLRILTVGAKLKQLSIELRRGARDEDYHAQRTTTTQNKSLQPLAGHSGGACPGGLGNHSAAPGGAVPTLRERLRQAGEGARHERPPVM